MKPLLVATAFLTRLPVSVEATGADVRAATRWFPAVGTALGTMAALVSMALTQIATPPLISATLIVAGGALITGAIHLDGLADTADGFGGGQTKEDVLRIMRDPRLGTFGALALIVVLGLKVAALTTLIERRIDAAVLIAAPTLARWTVVLLGRWLPYARSEPGLGEAATAKNDVLGLVIATLYTTAAVAVAMAGISALACSAAVIIAVIAIGRVSKRRIGGVTGDVFGASVELSETAVLTIAVLLGDRA